MDLVLVNPNSADETYQDLAKNYSAIETPTWCLLLANAVRKKNFKVKIIDCDAEKLSAYDFSKRVIDLNPKLVLFVVYGQQPNAGTTNMIGAYKEARELKRLEKKLKICFVGSHTSALPKEVLKNEFVDIVLLNEGVYALLNLLGINDLEDLSSIKGIGFKKRNKNIIDLILNTPEQVVPQSKMDEDLPGYAWDLLPYDKKPLDLYRAHFWHANFDHNQRTPFAAIYTSLGCQFACDFCMINILNRTDNSDDISSADSKGMRFWSPEFIINEFEKLHQLGVRTLRISDEMFFLNRKYYEPLLNEIIKRKYKFNMWAYSRIDTVRKDKLELFKKAGVNWLALGIEAGNQVIRQSASKGSFKDVNIRQICNDISDSGIKIISNYIFGLENDNIETMNETLNLALELNTEMANMYPCQALPGSPLHLKARLDGIDLPDKFTEYGFLSYDSKPLPTKYLTSAQVLKFRDEAWNKYFSNPKYLDLVEEKFGFEQRKNVVEMSKIKLKRKLLD